MTEQRLTDEQALAIEVKNADGLLPVQRAAAIARGHERWARAAILSANRVEPVAEVLADGATVRLGWASVQAAHNAKPGYLFAAAPSTPQPAPETDYSRYDITREEIDDAVKRVEAMRLATPQPAPEILAQERAVGFREGYELAMSRATPQPDTVQVPREPVAWRWRFKTDGGRWTYTENWRFAKDDADGTIEVQPVYAQKESKE